jgi:L-threonylcarbamoyladenylate synthase
MAEISCDIERARDLLCKGELVAIPTETVYGLAGNALDPNAVLKIFAVKQRPFFDPLIVHVASREALADYVTYVPDWAQQLAAHFWPGPLTLVLPKKPCIPDVVTSGLPHVAVRVPKHPVTQALLQQLAFPLAAPSANPFGYISPTCSAHVQQQLGREIAFILEGGICEVGLESTIVGEHNGRPAILRLGGISQEALEHLIGPMDILVGTSNPGNLANHYAPRTPLVFENEWQGETDVAMLRFASLHPDVLAERQIVLSERGDLVEAARTLFASLRRLDDMGARVIVAQRVPELGLGKAINDRLLRASNK